MPLAHICSHCGEPYLHGSRCECIGATAARARADRRRHERQRLAGRNSYHWRKLRPLVYRRDGFRCRYCGRHRAQFASNERLTVHLLTHGDHATASIDDCMTACSTCHGRIDGGRR